MIVRIYPRNPNEKAIDQIVRILLDDGVIVFPTDGVYALGCSLKSNRAIERIRAISGKEGPDLSIICSDLSAVALYAKVDTPTFKLLKRNLPGPFTFILNASGKVPDKFLERRKTVGIRIPDHPIPLAIVERLGHPLVTTSVKEIGGEEEYTTDPSLIYEHYEALIDALIDGGYGEKAPSTVVNCTGDEPEITRQGIGKLIL